MALTKVSTDGVKDDAITSGKIPANAVGASELADNAVDTNAIADDAVTHAKYQDIPTSRLLGRTSSGTGNPETLDASTVRTFLNVANGATFSNINGNVDHRVLTATGTTGVSQGESNLTFDGSKLGVKTASPIGTLDVHDGTLVLSKPSSNSSSRNWRFLPDNAAAGNLGLQVSTAAGGSTFSNVLEINSNGKVGLGTSSPQTPLHVYHATSNESIRCESGDEYVHIVFSDSTTTNEPYIGAQGNNLRAITGGAERMRLNSGGQTLIGTSNTNSCSAKLIVQADSIPSYYANSGGLNVNVTNSNDIHCAELFQGRYNRRVLTHSHSNTGNVTFDVFEQNDSNVGSITGNGSSVAFNTSSDYRLKENIINLTDGITRLKQLIPRRFNWISDSTNTLVDGFIAHEVSPVIPEAVTGEKDALEENGSIEPQAMDYGKVTPLLTAALQEAVAKIEVLETKVAALEAA